MREAWKKIRKLRLYSTCTFNIYSYSENKLIIDIFLIKYKRIKSWIVWHFTALVRKGNKHVARRTTENYHPFYDILEMTIADHLLDFMIICLQQQGTLNIAIDNNNEYRLNSFNPILWLKNRKISTIHLENVFFSK